MDSTGSESCQLAGFDVSGFEPSGSGTGELYY